MESGYFGMLLFDWFHHGFCANGPWTANERTGSSGGVFGSRNPLLSCEVSAELQLDAIGHALEAHMLAHGHTRSCFAAVPCSLRSSSAFTNTASRACCYARTPRVVQTGWTVAVWVRGRPLYKTGTLRVLAVQLGACSVARGFATTHDVIWNGRAY